MNSASKLEEARSTKDLTELWVCLGLVLLTASVYWSGLQCGFVNYDDDLYVTANPTVQQGINFGNLRWAFTTDTCDNWHPLTWLSHMLDCQLYGLRPPGHHATSLLLHIANSVLLLLLLNRLTGTLWRSTLVAALFALHPVHVESVAWIAERKDVLSTLFLLLTIWAYFNYVQKPGRWRYLAVLMPFAFGLMAKPMLVTLPCVLLLLDFWPLDRFSVLTPQPARDPQDPVGTPVPTRPSTAWILVEKLPLLALSAASCVVTLWAQRSVMNPLHQGFGHRLACSLLAYGEYVEKLVWPKYLAVLYPCPVTIRSWHVVLAATLLAVISLAVVVQAKRRPYLLTGWFWFAGMLVPVAGLVQVGFQFMADRYMYAPAIGLFIMLVWGGYDFLARFIRKPWALALVAASPVVGCILVTRAQLAYWRDSVTLFQHALDCTADNFVIESNLGTALLDRKDLVGARMHLTKALEINPHHAEALSNLGLLLATEGNDDEAIRFYRAAIREVPGTPEYHYNLARALLRKGQLTEAQPEMEAVVRLWPNHWVFRDQLGQIHLALGDPGPAVQQFAEAVRLNAGNATLKLHLARALRLDGKVADAIRTYRSALELDPKSASALNDLAWILATEPNPQFRNGAEAVALAERACSLSPGQPAALMTLAAAYAEAGRFDEAADTARRAEQLATEANNTALAGNIRFMLQSFAARHAFQEPRTQGNNGANN